MVEHTRTFRQPHPILSEWQQGQLAYANEENLDGRWSEERQLGWRGAAEEAGRKAFWANESCEATWPKAKADGYYKANDEHEAAIARVSRPEDPERTCGHQNCPQCLAAA